jgi:hypothetical protein
VHWRGYAPERDRDEAHRIWLETGWIEEDKAKVADLFIGAGRVVA